MAKKVQEAEEKPEEENLEENKVSLLAKGKKIFFRLVVLGVFGYAFYWAYQNPQIFEKQEDVKKSGEDKATILQINQMQNQIAALQAQLFNLPEPDMSSFENKVESLERQMLNVIDSKADANIALGLLARIDKLENRLDKVVKISDDGALILSAAMLVKQAASEGDEFFYEAEVLNQLTPQNASIKKDVSVILEYSHSGVLSKEELVRQFKKIHGKTVSKENEQGGNWKERLNQKFSEYIKIKKAGEENADSSNDEQWSEIEKFVDEGKFIKAIKLIESSDSDDINQNQDLQNWLADVKNRVSFEKAIRNIAAYSLAEMKVNNLKNKD